MNTFQQSKLDKAVDEHPLGVRSKFHAVVEKDNLVGIIFSCRDSTDTPYFYEIYDDTKMLGFGGGSKKMSYAKLEELVENRLDNIIKNRK